LSAVGLPSERVSELAGVRSADHVLTPVAAVLYYHSEKTAKSSASWTLRRFSPLAFNGVANRLLTRIPNSTAKVPIAPKSPFFPKLSFQFAFMCQPKLNGRFLL